MKVNINSEMLYYDTYLTTQRERESEEGNNGYGSIGSNIIQSHAYIHVAAAPTNCEYN